MGYYKFLHSLHVDRLLKDGTIRLSALSYYRELEGKQWIADRLEGAVEVHVDHLVVRGDEPFAPEGFSPRVKIGEGTVTSCTFVYQHPEVFIFCASEGDPTFLAQVMCEGGKDGYDACVRIIDMELLAHRIFYRGIVSELGAAKVSHAFRSYRCATVTYSNLSLEQKNVTTRLFPPSPFLKHNIFAGQREVRIALEPRAPIPQNNITIKIPRPEQIFVEEFRGRSARLSPGT